MDGVAITQEKKIYHPKGYIYHGIKKSSPSFEAFGEAYFSNINKDEIKGWKKHSKMLTNILVPIGEIKFVIFNEFTKNFFTVNLSPDNYKRLTIWPGLWMAFKGIGENNMLLNIASIEHEASETSSLDLKNIKYDW